MAPLIVAGVAALVAILAIAIRTGVSRAHTRALSHAVPTAPAAVPLPRETLILLGLWTMGWEIDAIEWNFPERRI